jgi:hypothetical protein
VAGVAAADGTPGVCEDVRKVDREFGKHGRPLSFFLLLTIHGNCGMKTYDRLKDSLLLQINQAL